MKHLLVTNDFPPKIGGIQSYLWELWRRLDPNDVTVLTTPYPGARDWDNKQAFKVVRTLQRWLLPTKALVNQINELAREVEAKLIVLDPVFPLGILGPKLELPYVAIAHGAEYVIPGKIPLTKPFVRQVTNNSVGIIACGDYVADSVRQVKSDKTDISIVNIPPGVDAERFIPLGDDRRKEAREKFGMGQEARVVVGVSRLVPRKGFDRLIEAAAAVKPRIPGIEVYIAGKGRDEKRLRKIIERLNAPVKLLGRISDADLPELYGAADVFSMPCHDRWFGLEREGFGIVFVEAGAAGVASVAGLSGGSGEAVVNHETGLVVDGSVSVQRVADALMKLLTDHSMRLTMAKSARQRAEELFSYEHLAKELTTFLNMCLVSTEK